MSNEYIEIKNKIDINGNFNVPIYSLTETLTKSSSSSNIIDYSKDVTNGYLTSVSAYSIGNLFCVRFQVYYTKMNTAISFYLKDIFCPLNKDDTEYYRVFSGNYYSNVNCSGFINAEGKVYLYPISTSSTSGNSTGISFTYCIDDKLKDTLLA